MADKLDYLTGICDLFDPAPSQELLPYCETGKVLKAGSDLTVQVRGLIYRSDQIKVNGYWTAGHTREIEIPTAPFTGSDTRGDGHTSGGFPKATIVFKDGLKVGDEVACLQSRSKQTLYVLFRIGR